MSLELQYWMDVFENKTTKDLEAIEMAVQVILKERDNSKYGSIVRGNKVGSGLQAA